jgi:hypothetical protein
MQLLFSRAVLLFVTFAGLASSLALASACFPLGGGCPWTEVSPVTVQPATSCLTITVENPNGGGSFGGCVSPDLSITNACADALVLDGSNLRLLGPNGLPVEQDAGSVSIAAGSTGVVDVDLTSSTGAQSVKGTLGAQPVTLSFTTQR